MKDKVWRLLLSFCLITSLFSFTIKPAKAQTGNATVTLANMTPAEKVGQLFLVTFDGSTAADTSAIYDLITNYHLGGVVLNSENGNFTDEIGDTWQLIQNLQEINWQKNSENGTYVPLYVGMSLVRNDNHTPQLLNGISDYPSPMSIGASWSTEIAQEVGALVGRELSALGINLLLGPSLDVVDSKNIVAADYAGTQSFGGDPFWVGEMGKAYVEGVHKGSENKISVIARHFPGLGSVDRSPLDEVSTVQKTLDQLEQIELAPYMSLVSSETSQQRVDGLMISAIRFQGLQGNIRATTMPVNFDQSALNQLLSPEPLAEWRDNGGLIISDSLGSPAVQLVFNSGEDEFDPLTVARTAFLAGNDLLYLDNFKENNGLSQTDTIIKTIEFFRQKYREDALFAQRVDESVLKILQAKENLYPEFDYASVQSEEEGLAILGQAEALELKVNRRAATLLAPSAEFLNSTILQAPGVYDRITIF